MKLIFWVGKTGIQGDLVKWWTKSETAHVEILFSDNMMGSSRYELGGISLIPFYTKNNWKYIDIPCTPEDEKKVRQFFEVDEKGCKYDWSGIILAQVFNTNFQSKTKWFCSEACMSAIQRILPEFKDYKPYKTSPQKMLEIFIKHGYKVKYFNEGVK